MIAADRHPVNVLWLTSGLGCDGDSVAMTAARNPSFEDLIRGCFPGAPPVVIYNPLLAYEIYKENLEICVAAEKFGFDAKPLANLIHWGDIIDGAQFASPADAVSLTEPATQLALVIEAAPETDLVPKLIPHLAYKSLAEMVELPIVKKHLGPLLERHRKSLDVFRERADFRDGVIFFDVSDLDLEGYNKFVPYFLFPDALYSVGVSSSPLRAKVSVGTNPWKEASADVNLASLCERYGGGGHARVAAISLGPGDLVRARQVAQEIAATLRRHK